MIEEENINTLQDGYHVHHVGDEDSDEDYGCKENEKFKSKLGLQYTMEGRKISCQPHNIGKM